MMVGDNLMTKEQKKAFVEQLISSVQSSILEKIQDDVVPEVWEGVELREYIAYRFQQCTMWGPDKQNKARKRAFKNTVLVRPL